MKGHYSKNGGNDGTRKYKLLISGLGYSHANGTYREPKVKTNVNALFWLLDI